MNFDKKILNYKNTESHQISIKLNRVYGQVTLDMWPVRYVLDFLKLTLNCTNPIHSFDYTL